MSRRDPSDVIDRESGKVRVLSSRCETCVFRPGTPFEDRAEDLAAANVATGALLTCHSTLPYGEHPEFGPAVCAGFWARHGMQTAAGRIAKRLLGVVRIMPPGDETDAATAGEEN